MQFGLIDSDASYRSLLRYYLEVEWPDATVLEFDNIAEAESPADELGEFDAFLVGIPLAGESGFAGVERLLSAGSPPVLLFAAEGDELLAVDALRAGAASYFPKDRLTHQRLIETLREDFGSDRGLSDAPLIGTHGQYRFLRVLHSTDVATVYLAVSTETEAELAVKVIRYVPDAGSEGLFDRFLQEYEIIAGVDHPNVVRIFDLGIADDHAFIAMEYLANGRLSDRLGQPLEPDRAVGYLAQVGGALEAIHQAGILHRDLKPANIMFREDESIALIDFGLAKRMRLEAMLTGQGQIFGTPFYMSPEQGHAEPTDERSDLYSLGCIFYEMLTGERPFSSSTAMGVIYLHANAPRPRLGRALVAYQPLLDRLVAIRPEDRFQSVAELLTAIDTRAGPSASQRI